uniref:Uncharacterized protein n=1 Tax=Arundo donax TaxID=35708 RepID=A0A0A9CV01_ARUDO
MLDYFVSDVKLKCHLAQFLKQNKLMEDREWMYNGWSRGWAPSNDWIENTNHFIDCAFSMPSLV